MTTFAADLHIHSRYSRATSKGLTVRSLAAWAEVKGVGVLGTGDCTHPGWLDEIGRELVDDGSGLLRLRDASGLVKEIPGLAEHHGAELSGHARFMLQGEISSIYKRGGRVRKVHNLVYLPTLEAARALNQKLAQVGNLASDGRPILGLDSRTLLRLVLDTHPEAFLVPAHIWTPWFSLFGSMSGFDSVEECYGDLSEHIFAMETGLSSDPGMNWTISALDRYRMISNSDAHSGEKLAREANLFRGQPSFSGIRQALRAHQTGIEGDCEFLGTVEFFPEEGKYHMDGHRKCNWSMEPGETVANRGLCPVCGKPATLGVLHRVLALADRPEPVQPEGQPGYDSLIPLKEVLSEVLDVGSGSKKVALEYFRLITALGPELFILREAPLPDIRRASPVLAEAVERMRAGKVLRKSGFDGEFGVITVFTPEERAEMRHGGRLVAAQGQRGRKRAVPAQAQPGSAGDPEAAGDPEPAAQADAPALRPDGLNQAQAVAVYAGPGPTLVLAGPGTGKTHTLIRRVERLLDEGVPADALAVVTFTRRAAGELSERLAALRGPGQPLPLTDTLHALALALWTMRRGQPPVLLSEDAARKLFLESLPESMSKPERAALFRRHSLARESLAPLAGPTAGTDGTLAAQAQAEVAGLKAARNLADFTDLIEFLLAEVRQPGFSPPFSHLLVDEIQDLSALQLEAVLGLAGPPGNSGDGGQGFFAIGDPNQSIYGFRGAAGNVQGRLAGRWPRLNVLALAENYRSGQGILDAARAVLAGAPANTPLPALRARPGMACQVELVQTPDAHFEARCIAERARKLLGGTSLTLLDAQAPPLAPGDIAVLVRFRALINPLKAALEQAGLPCSAPEAEVFWEEPRVAAILRVAEKLFGLPAANDSDGDSGDGSGGGSDGGSGDAPENAPNDRAVAVNLPEFLLLQGPRVLPPALRESPPFDRFFWEGPAFRDLCQEFDAHHGWVGLLDWVRLQAGLAELRHSAQKVRIMTLHAAKGLEFEAVFLPALEEGILPFAGPGWRPEDAAALAPEVLAEERRLLYVGMTRAKSSLCLSFARERTLYGRRSSQTPSRLLEALPRDALRRRQIIQKVQSKQTHLSLF